jgi:peptidoglycan/LPS O-acetylase OafA/YrhL
MLDLLAEFFADLLAALIPRRYERPLVLALCVLAGMACFAVGAYFLFQASLGRAEPLLAWPALPFAVLGWACFAIAKRGLKSSPRP